MTRRLFFLGLLAISGYFLYQTLWRNATEQVQAFPIPVMDWPLDSVQTIHLDFISAEEEQHLLFRREGNRWLVSNGALSAPAEITAMQQLIDLLEQLQLDSLLSESRREQDRYRVTPERAYRVQFRSDARVLTTFFLSQPYQGVEKEEPDVFLRYEKAKEIFAVREPPQWPLMLSFQQFRAKFGGLTAGEVDQVYWCRGQDTTLLQWQDTTWLLGETQLDWMDSYLSNLEDLKGVGFDDRFNPVASGHLLSQFLEFHAGGTFPLLRVDCYFDSVRVPPFILHSSQQPDVFFQSDSAGLYRLLFQPFVQLDSLDRHSK